VKRLIVILTGAMLLAAFGFARMDPVPFSDAKRELRLALGLPKLWVRDFNDKPAGYERLACPGPEAMVIVTGGQSNAANAFSDPLLADPAAQALMMHDGHCYRLRDPVLGATDHGGSLWTGLGSALWRATGRPVVFINGAVGGSQLGDWLDDRSRYRQRLMAEVAMAQQVGLVPDYVMWIQGETDAAVLIDPQLYVEQMRQLVDRFDASGVFPADTPWIVFRSTRCKHRPGNGPEIDAAVTRWALHFPRIVLGPLASALGDDMRRDQCHFNGAGRAELIRETLPIFAAEAAVRPAGARKAPAVAGATAPAPR
jgi:hypothetical protein